MIRDFETRLAAVLAARLPAPFAGHVVAAPAAGTPGDDARLVVAVERVEPGEHDIGSIRSEVVPGEDAPRRVLRLTTTVVIGVQHADDADRAQQVAAIDALLFALDAPELRNATALQTDGDPGFLLESLDLVRAEAALDPEATDAVPVAVTLRARGLFWPIGAPGVDGPTVVRVRLREGIAAVQVDLPPDGLLAGGPAATLAVQVDGTGTLELTEDEPPTSTAFGTVAARLVDRDGAPGKGVLGGGTAGTADGVRLIDLSTGRADITYTPPGEPAIDFLLLALDDGEGGASVDLGRVPLSVGPA